MGPSVFRVPSLVRMFMGFIHPRTMQIHRWAGSILAVVSREGVCVTLTNGALPGVKSRPLCKRDVVVRRNADEARGSDLFRLLRF